jgi:hypothetical protein
MANSDGPSRPRRSRPATTPEGRENQVIALAFDLVEKRIRNGTATSQEVTHFLKLGSSREKLEQERLRHENELTAVKINAIASAERQEELYREALNAMRSYSGQDPIEYGD